MLSAVLGRPAAPHGQGQPRGAAVGRGGGGWRPWWHWCRGCLVAEPAAHVTVEIGGRLIGSVCEPGTPEGSRVCCWDGSNAGQEGISGSAYSERRLPPGGLVPAAPVLPIVITVHSCHHVDECELSRPEQFRRKYWYGIHVGTSRC
jgi:hypothetical protein